MYVSDCTKDASSVQQSSNVVIIGVQPPQYVVQQSQRQSQFAPYVYPTVLRVFGALLIVAGVLALAGQILETVGYGIIHVRNTGKYTIPCQEYMEYSCTFVKYAGYWCGIIMIIGGSLAMPCRINDCTAIMSFVSSIIGFAFSTVLLVLSAKSMVYWKDHGLLSNNFYTTWDYLQFIIAGISTMVGAGGLGVIFALILTISSFVTLCRGCGYKSYSYNVFY